MCGRDTAHVWKIENHSMMPTWLMYAVQEMAHIGFEECVFFPFAQQKIQTRTNYHEKKTFFFAAAFFSS